MDEQTGRTFPKACKWSMSLFCLSFFVCFPHQKYKSTHRISEHRRALQLALLMHGTPLRSWWQFELLGVVFFSVVCLFFCRDRIR